MYEGDYLQKVGASISAKHYPKSVASNTIPKATACHPEHTLKDIPVGKMTRAKRNCSSHVAYLREEQEIYEILRKHDYPTRMLNRATNIVKHCKSRQNLFKYWPKTDNSRLNRPTFVTVMSFLL